MAYTQERILNENVNPKQYRFWCDAVSDVASLPVQTDNIPTGSYALVKGVGKYILFDAGWAPDPLDPLYLADVKGLVGHLITATAGEGVGVALSCLRRSATQGETVVSGAYAYAGDAITVTVTDTETAGLTLALTLNGTAVTLSAEGTYTYYVPVGATIVFAATGTEPAEG